MFSRLHVKSCLQRNRVLYGVCISIKHRPAIVLFRNYVLKMYTSANLGRGYSHQGSLALCKWFNKVNASYFVIDFVS